MRQVYQGEHRSADDGEGGKQSEVLQQVGLYEDKSHERAYGGEAAQQYGLGLVAQHLLRVGNVFIVRHDV